MLMLTASLVCPALSRGAPRPVIARGESSATVATDSLAGVIATCIDFRSTESFGVYAQHVRADGSIASGWSPDGSRLCLGSTLNVATSLLADGSGGAFVVWVDGRSGEADLYAQHLGANGSVTTGWPQEGIAVCVVRGGQAQVSLCADAAGGVLIAWQDHRGGESGDIYAQHLTSSGALAWQADGVALCAEAFEESSPALSPDGSGGAVLVWEDHRTGFPRLRSRVVHGDGTTSADAALATVSLGTQRDPVFAGGTQGGSGGGVLIWDEHRSDGLSLRATRLDASGGVAAGWPEGGVALAAGVPRELSRAAMTDSAGGVWVAWSAAGETPGEIRAQRLGEDGSLAWAAGGVAVCEEAHEQYAPAIASDRAGGAIIAWEDHRNGRADLYAQRVLASGSTAWDSNGVALCRMPGDQYGVALASDGAGGAYATWSDAARSSRATFVRAHPTFTGAVPALLSCELGPGRARLTFRTHKGDQRTLQMERRAPNEPWTLVRSVQPDAEGLIVVEDRTVAPGAHATYRLSLAPGEGGVVHFDEIALEIPEAMALALRYAANDAGGRALRIALVLASNGSARIEVLDVQGRRVLTQEIGGLGAGAHELRLPFAERSPGLYFVRLHQGPQTRTARVVVVR